MTSEFSQLWSVSSLIFVRWKYDMYYFTSLLWIVSSEMSLNYQRCWTDSAPCVYKHLNAVLSNQPALFYQTWGEEDETREGYQVDSPFNKQQFFFLHHSEYKLIRRMLFCIMSTSFIGSRWGHISLNLLLNTHLKPVGLPGRGGAALVSVRSPADPTAGSSSRAPHMWCIHLDVWWLWHYF